MVASGDVSMNEAQKKEAGKLNRTIGSLIRICDSDSIKETIVDLTRKLEALVDNAGDN